MESCVGVCLARPAPSCVFPRSWDHPSGWRQAQRKRLADRVVLSLPVRSRVDLFCLIWFCWARCTSSAGVHCPTCLPIYLSTHLPRHASYGTDGGGGGDCLGRLGGVGPTDRLFGCGSCFVAFFSILPMSRWRRSSAAETDVRFSTGDTVVRPSSCLGHCAPIQCDLRNYENFQDLVVL